jgi:hypothetical protein
MPKGDYANGMLATAADNPLDREALSPATFADRFGGFAPPTNRDELSAISATDLPASLNQSFVGPQSPLEWRYALANMDPRERELLMRYTQAEVGGQGRNAALQFMETVANRWRAEGEAAQARGQAAPSITDILTNPIASGHGGNRYYPGATKFRVSQGLTDPQRGYYGDIISQLAGDPMTGQGPSNVSNYATGNESGNVRSGGAPVVSRSGGGERFVAENWTLPWYRQMTGQAPIADIGTGGTQVADSGSVARPGSSPTVASGTTASGDMSSLGNASLAAALMPYFSGAAEAQKGTDYSNIIGKMAVKPTKSEDTDYRSFFRPLRSTYGQFG